MKNIRYYTTTGTAAFFILLFCYASLSKALDFENFQVQIGQSPLLSAYAGPVSYGVIVIEIFTVILLCTEKLRTAGLYISTALMSAFTVYIYLILNYSDFVPCSCGGILEKLGWTEHLVFNIVCVILGICAVLCEKGSRNISLQKSLVFIVSSNALSIFIVILLFISSEHIVKQENNFTRRFLLYSVTENKSRILDYSDYYFAGEDQENIYLGNKQYPLLLTTVSKDFSKASTLKIVPENTKFPFKSLQLAVKDSHYFLWDGTVPVIFRGKTGDPNAKIISYQDAFFSQLTVQDSSHFIIRSINSRSKSLTAASLSLHDHPKIIFYPEIIERYTDGFFESDGQLSSTDSPFQVIYLYNYRNRFTVSDRKLNIQHHLKTIDTVNVARIQTRKLSDGRHKMIAPPLKVNQNISAQGNLVFIQSALMGKNESASRFKKAKVIDIYKLNAQEYLGSFYLYNEGENQLIDYMAGKEYFYALIGKKLIRYSYRKPLTKDLTGEAENLDPE